MNLSLLDASYKSFQNGSGKCGKGLSIQTQSMRDGARQIDRARSLGLELIRDDIADTDRIVKISDHIASSSNPHDRHFNVDLADRMESEVADTDQHAVRHF